MRRRCLFTVAALGAAAVACGPAEQKKQEPQVSEGAEFIRYGDAVGQFGELSRPEGDPRGLVIVAHGGFWKPEYGIEYAQPLVPSLVETGWAAWVIEYRRGTGADDTLADVRAAIDAAPIDTDMVIGLGHSAGGHLMTWAAAGGGLTHVVSQAGVLDLRAAHDAGLGGGAVEAFLGHPPGPDDADVDPARQVPLDVPVWCVHGTSDTIVPPSQSVEYVEAATAAGGRATLVDVDGDHFTVIDVSSGAWARTVEVLASLA